MGETYALELKDISKRFGSVQANDHVNLTLRKSEILAILGENGSGKTTLMNMIYGIYYPDEGHIFVRAYLERKELVIEVSDDGCGISDEVIRRLGNRDKEQKNGHIGFYNVDTIIRLHYGKDYGLRAERLAAGGTKVTIRIPVNGSGEPDPGVKNRS